MGNVNEGGAESLMNLGELGSHRRTELSVEVRQRLVEKEDLRVTDDSTTKRDTLLLTAGKCLRTAVKKVSDIEDARSFLNAALDLLLRSLAELESERHVIENRHVRIKSVVLEHHRNVAVLRCDIVYEAVADEKAHRRRFPQVPRSYGGSLSYRIGRTDKNQKLLILYLKAEVGYCSNSARIFLINVLKR